METELLSESEAIKLEVAPWDQLAPSRALDLDAGTDLSFRHVLLPTTLGLVGKRAKRSVVDVGCGTGRLATELAGISARVVGVDPSSVSIELAKVHAQRRHQRIAFETSTAHEASLAYPGQFEAAVANMVLMDVVDLRAMCDSIAALLRPRGTLVATITHPHFWSDYWGYSAAPWFEYGKQLFIRSEFRTSTMRSGISTLHCHRPLETYSKALHSAGFRELELFEPRLPPRIQTSSGVSWTTPHFLALRARLSDRRRP